jgi:chemotaxis protein MotA
MVLTPTGLGIYLDLNSVIIVVFGSIAAMFVAAPIERMRKVRVWFGIIFSVKSYDRQETIRTLVEFSEKARKEGLLSLDDSLDQVKDDFLRGGMRLVVDGTDPEIIKSILYNNLSQMETRHEEGASFFDFWAKMAPAFGMLGTLIGLIALMGNLEDKAALGASMAVALITTLYGSVLANLFFLPMKNKLEEKSKAESNQKEIIIEGILSIQAGDNPRILEQKLLTFVSPADKKRMLEGSEG